MIATLNPAYFSLVMATEIVSLACHDQGLLGIAIALFASNVFAFAVLLVLHSIRVVRFPRLFLEDVADQSRGVVFFTIVAASCVLGSQFLMIAHWRGVAIGLWVFGVGCWFVSNYAIFACLTLRAIKPSLPDGIHGGWLVSVLGTQAVAMLGGMLAGGFGTRPEPVLFFSLVNWLGGGMNYIWIISLIV